MPYPEPDDAWSDPEINAGKAEEFARDDEDACRAEAAFERDMILIPELQYMWDTEPEYMRTLSEVTNV
ncbi:hypothetical protein HAP94_19500 [Acidithiobacillus ferrivorans]|nr:hypothetical protein [Acidithiobacillus ferrivorans]